MNTSRAASDFPVAGVVLASGLSLRFGERNKLLAPFGQATVVRRTVQAYLDGNLQPVLVVVGHQADQVRSALAGLSITDVYNPEFEQGQSRALVRAVNSLPEHTAAAIIGVADQPLLTGDVIRELATTYHTTRATLVVPRYAGRRGNPALFDRRLFPELLQVTGDRGGRPVLEAHRQEIVWLDVPDARMAADVDTLEDYRALLDL
jgi:molybdenum cofactor cytidylyltransferase